MSNNTGKRILIDTDLGDDTDDAAALIMAMNSTELEIVGITTVYQNTYKRAEMVLDLCEQYGKKEIEVCAGYGIPLIERPYYEEDPIQYEILRKERKYPVYQEMNGAEFIIQKAKENPDLTIVEMGAMTNLAKAFYEAPDIMKQTNIIAMGGVFSSSFPEWNIRCDPEAARIVMDYAEHLTMFGLDVTKYCRISEEFLEKLCPPGNERMHYYKRGTEIFKEKTGYPITFHDALLIAYLLDPTVVNLRQNDFNVELSGENTRGAIVYKTNAYDIHVEVEKDFKYAEWVDVEKFRSIVKERIY